MELTLACFLKSRPERHCGHCFDDRGRFPQWWAFLTQQEQDFGGWASEMPAKGQGNEVLDAASGFGTAFT